MNEQLKIIISAEIDKLKKGVDDAKKQMSEFQKHSQNASKNVDKNFKAIGDACKNGLKAVAVGVTATTTALLALGASTMEYREAQAKLTSAFETAGASAETAKGVYNDLYRVLGDSDVAVEASNHLAQMTTNEKELSEWTNICQGVFATFGDSLPIEGLTEASNETAKVGQVTGVLADALNWAGISEDEFNAKLSACNSEAEREALIRETLNGVYSEASANYEKNASAILAQNEAQARLQESTALLGEAVQPVVTAFTNFASEALAIVIPYIQQLAENYLPQLQAVLSVVADALGVAFGFVTNNIGILSTVAGVIMTIVTAIGLYNTVQAIKTALDISGTLSVSALTTALWANVTAMTATLAPYLAVVAGITAVIAIIVLCVKHWDEIKAKVVEVAQAIQQKVSEMVEKVSTYFTNLWNRITTAVSNIRESVVSKFNEIKSNIVNTVQGAVQGAIDKFNNMKSTVTSVASSIFSTISSKFQSIKDKITSTINGAKDAVSTAINGIKGIMNFSWSLPKLKMPHISISGKFSINPPSVPRFSISWYKLGGVFDSPTLFPWAGGIGGLGEDGAEAIVPLERNTKWLDRIATMLNEKIGGGRPIILEVDGKTFAKISVDSINDLTRQTGSLPLKLA